MSSVPAKFREYIWLVETIAKAKRITLPEINEKWLRTEMSEGIDLARSTFNRHRDAIAEIFGVYIECDRTDGYKYYIMNAGELQSETVQNWMLTTLSVNNVLLDSLSVRNRILLERIPSGGDNIKVVVEAMKSGNRLKIEYQKYGEDLTTVRIVEPYCIKLYHQRWYMLAKQRETSSNLHFETSQKPQGGETDNSHHTKEDYYRLFAFDRINDIEVLKEKFKMAKDFDAAEYFEDSFGVVANDGTEIEEVVVRAYGSERYYLRDLPLHRSQREIGIGNDWADFMVRVRPTLDLTGQILSRGARLKVLRPQWLADEVKRKHLEAAGMYKTVNIEIKNEE